MRGDNVFAEIKAAVDIAAVCRDYGIEPDRQNKALCPFHTEKTPSFSVSREKQRYHCFGCGEGGDVIDLVANLEKISPLEAARKLDMDYGLNLFETSKNGGKKHSETSVLESKKRRRKAARTEMKTWADGAHDDLCQKRRALFAAGQDCAYADFLLDSLEEDPLGFRAAYGSDVSALLPAAPPPPPERD
ncbi:MAG: CHC2 zinc finger domain-containing protein [Bacillota bacterium]|jgi:DNA primase